MTDAILRFGARDVGLDAKFRKTNEQLDAFGRASDRTSNLIGAGFKAAIGVIGAVSFTRLATEAFAYAEALEVASAKTGIALDNLQRLQFIADQSDVSFDSVTASINKFQRGLVEGSKEVSTGLARINLSIGELVSLEPDAQFLRIAESIAQIESPAERTATAMELFGRGGAELLPLLNEGAEGVRELSAQFDRFGITLSAETIAKVDDAGDAFSRLGASIKAIGVEIVSLPAPLLESTANGITLFFNALRFGLKDGLTGDTEQDLETRIRRTEDLIDMLKFDQSEHGVRRLRELNAQLEHLNFLQQVLLDVGEGGAEVDPLQRLGIDLDKIKAPTIRGLPTEPTAAELRQDALVAGETSLTVQALEEKDVLLEINQDRLDELLRQEEEFFLDRNRLLSDGEEFLQLTRELYGNEQILYEQIKNQSIIDIAGGLFTALAAENSKLAKIQQAIAIAETVWSTAKGIAKAAASQQWAVAAKIALVGAIQIAKIKATNYHGGGVSGGSAPTVAGGSAATSSTTSAETDEQLEARRDRDVTTIVFNGPVAGEEAFIELLDRAFNNRGVVVIRRSSPQAAEIMEPG